MALKLDLVGTDVMLVVESEVGILPGWFWVRLVDVKLVVGSEVGDDVGLVVGVAEE